MAFVWDDMAVAVLRREWPKGTRAADIAKMIGASSKNAVIGKAGRIGLGPHVNSHGKDLASTLRQRGRRGLRSFIADHSPFAKAAVKAAGRAEWIEKKFSEPPRTYVPPSRRRADLPPLVARVTLDELEPEHCRFPVGDPGKPSFGFCGQNSVPGKVYCSDCCERAYAPRETRVSRQSRAGLITVSPPETASKRDGAAEAALRDAVEG